MEIYLKNMENYNEKLLKYQNYIKDINNFDKSKFINQLKFIRNIYINNNGNFINVSTDTEIERRVNSYFNKQNDNNLKLGHIISIIKFQHIIISYIYRLLNDIINYYNNRKSINIINFTTITSKIIPNNNDRIEEILINYVNRQKLKDVTHRKNIKPRINESDKIVADKIKCILEIILKTILIIKSNECLSYGSFTCYNIDNSIEYNDIDLYSTDAYRILMFFMVIIYFIIGHDTCLFSIPYITGHISLKYKSISMIDCIFLDKATINSINKVLINNMYFVDPGLQMLNNFRMLSENFRSFKIYDDMKNAFIKYSTLLKFFINNNHKFNMSRLNYWISTITSISCIQYKVDNNVILISIKELVPNSPFDYIMIVLDSPATLMNKLSTLNGVFSRKYGAFLNEIFFETFIYNKRENRRAGKNLTQLIDENKIIKIDRNSIDYPYNILPNKKYLIFSNLTTSTYVYQKNNKIIDISLKNLVSFLATTCLYNLLHKRDDFAMELYYIVICLLKFKDPRSITEYNEITRYKVKGEHIEISLCKNLYNSLYNNIIFLDNFLDYKTFIEVTNINGGF
jgi:hypothetical protein